MFFSNLKFFAYEALVGLNRSRLMFFTSIATIAMSLTVFGLFLLISLNINEMPNYLTSRFEIMIILKPDLSPQEMKNFHKGIANRQTVKKARFISKAEAWDDIKKTYAHLQLGKLLDKNPAPDSISVFIKNIRHVQPFVDSLKKETKTIEEVIYSGEISEKLATLTKYSQIAGLSLVILLLVATLLIIVNTIRLTVIARNEEVTIMQLVGATNGLIRGPFLFEGMLIGLLGSIGACFILNIGYNYILNTIMTHAPLFPIVNDTTVLFGTFSIVFITGPVIGLLGSNISISRSLKL